MSGGRRRGQLLPQTCPETAGSSWLWGFWKKGWILERDFGKDDLDPQETPVPLCSTGSERHGCSPTALPGQGAAAEQPRAHRLAAARCTPAAGTQPLQALLLMSRAAVIKRRGDVSQPGTSHFHQPQSPTGILETLGSCLHVSFPPRHPAASAGDTRQLREHELLGQNPTCSKLRSQKAAARGGCAHPCAQHGAQGARQSLCQPCFWLCLQQRGEVCRCKPQPFAFWMRAASCQAPPELGEGGGGLLPGAGTRTGGLCLAPRGGKLQSSSAPGHCDKLAREPGISRGCLVPCQRANVINFRCR